MEPCCACESFAMRLSCRHSSAFLLNPLQLYCQGIYFPSPAFSLYLRWAWPTLEPLGPLEFRSEIYGAMPSRRFPRTPPPAGCTEGWAPMNPSAAGARASCSAWLARESDSLSWVVGRSESSIPAHRKMTTLVHILKYTKRCSGPRERH